MHKCLECSYVWYLISLTSTSWDKLYTNEITNHTEDPDNVGTIWFDDSDAEEKVLEFLYSQFEETHDHDHDLKLDTKTCSVLDLGTGNGHFLFRLRQGLKDSDDEENEREGWAGRMLGIDYSQKSVEFAKRIAESKGYGQNKETYVEFRTWDLLKESKDMVLDGEQVQGWDLVHDKGTFDAISLNKEKDIQGRRICEGYKGRVVPLIKKNGLLLITSCNWTEEELRSWFEDEELLYWKTIQYRSFQFGGRKGQTVSSVCFRKS